MREPGGFELFEKRRFLMLRWAIAFLIIAVIAGLFGFWGLESTAASIAKILFVAFLVLAVASFVLGRRSPV
jgi:uncharacterized membrane protein YtjA (UPF0391 family)